MSHLKAVKRDPLHPRKHQDRGLRRLRHRGPSQARGCAYGLGGLHDFADGKHLTPTSNLCHDTEARRPVDLMPHRTAISPRLLPRINPGSEEDQK